MIILHRIVLKILLILSQYFYFDPYSTYLMLLPSRWRIKGFSLLSMIADDLIIKGKITVPSPPYIEIRENVSLDSLTVVAGKYVLIEKNVNVGDLYCPHHTIVTHEKTYVGYDVRDKLITLSVDFEAAVGLSHASVAQWSYLKNFWDSSAAVNRLAQLFLKYRIPVTWAVCGHLFLEDCDGNHDITENDWYGDWFKYDPGRNKRDASGWYMPETIRMLRDEPLFEIGYHSFGHYLYHRCSEETVLNDIIMAEMIREKWDLELDTFVFPYNRCGYFDLLIREGHFRNFRGNIGHAYFDFGHGLVDFGEFHYFNTNHMFAPDKMELCNSRIAHLSSETANYYTHCYQWIEKDGWKQLEGWLKSLSNIRDSGKIRLERMGDVASRSLKWHLRS
jgi:hypothetical protein